MRLIDADAFAEFIEDAICKCGYKDLPTNEYVTVSLVLEQVVSELDGTSLEGFKNAPTVEAIPVDWIENYASEIANKAKANPFAYRGYAEGADWIRNMIKNWREEHETD